jgi:hypothetical protein
MAAINTILIIVNGGMAKPHDYRISPSLRLYRGIFAEKGGNLVIFSQNHPLTIFVVG